jgi:Fe-S cluster assembly scaffold protein SufB
MIYKSGERRDRKKRLLTPLVSFPKDFTKASVEALSQLKNEPSWMTSLRLAAWDVYASSPLKPESFSLDQVRSFTEPPKSPVPSHEWPRDLQHALEERGDEEGLIVQRDSTILSRSITKDSSKKGVIFTDLDTAVRTCPELVQRYFGRLVKPDNPFTALQRAFWSGGTFLYVPENYIVTLPFHTCFWMSTPTAGIFPHTLLVVEQGSRVSVIDECVSPDWEKPGLSIGATEAFVGPEAQVHYFHLQNWGESIYPHFEERSDVVYPGRFFSYRMDMGGQRPANRLRLVSTQDTQRPLLIEAPFDSQERLETVLQQVPITSVAEKLRYYVQGWQTGHRPSLTLARVAELHPEIRL